MYASLRGRLRQAGLFFVLLALVLLSNGGGGTAAQEAGLRWDGLIELISSRYMYQPPVVEPPLPADGNSTMSRRGISADGRYILFNSDASNLGMGYQAQGLYLRDRRTNETRLLLAGPALNGTLSADGNHVAFEICDPYARPQPRPDGLPICDVYALDLRNWTWTLMSALSDGTPGDDHSTSPILSGNGRMVVFRTKAANLSGGAPGITQLVLRDRDPDGNGVFDEPGNVVLETVSLGGVSGQERGNQDSDTAEVSDDGLYVAFRSLASNLVAGDQNGVWDVFVRDRSYQQTRRINLRGGIQESTFSIDSPQISMTPDGRYIAYASADPMLAAAPYDDYNGFVDVFVHDTFTGWTHRVDVGYGPPIAAGIVPGNAETYWPTLSADGRYVSLLSLSTNVEVPPTYGGAKVYVVDRALQTVTRVDVRPDGGQPDSASIQPAISGDGTVVTFLSRASNLARQFYPGVDHIYAAVHFDLTPPEVLVPGSGGLATFTVTTQQHTQWWIDWTYWESWFQLEGNFTGNGNGELRLRVNDPNPNAQRRSYTVRVHDKTALFTQLEGMSLTSISPTSGPATGGTHVTLTGTGFEPGVHVWFNGVEAAAQFINSTTVIATTPPHLPGPAWVATFSENFNQNAWIDNAFRFTDVSPPQVFAWASGTQITEGWYVDDVGVSFGWLDDETPVTSTSGCNSVLVTSDTPGTTFTCSATSEGGTGSASITVRRDATPPTIVVSAPAPGQLYERDAQAAFTFSCSDAVSGVGQCGLATPSGAPIDTSTPGWHTLTAAATDVAGNANGIQVDYAVSTDVCVAGLPNMVAWWRMEGNTRNTRSNSTSTATRVGLPADVYVDAITGQGYQFEGPNGYLSTSFSYRLPESLRHTIAAWVKPSANTYGTIIRKKDQFSVARTTNGTLAWAYRKFNVPTISYQDTGVKIPLGVWSHIAVVLEGTEVRTYLNGRLAHTLPNVGDVYTWDNLTEPITIGGAQDRPDYFKGVLDELQLYNNTLTAAQIESLFLAGPAGACPPKATQFVWTAPIQATYGAQTYRVEIALRDELGQPVVDRPVQLVSIVGAWPLSTSTANRVTDANGSVYWDAPLKNAPPGTYVDYLSATFNGDDEYVRAYAEPTVVVNRITPVITWAAPSAITYGVPLGSLQLNATASVPGTFSYSPTAGTVLGAGPRTLNVTFTPGDTIHYTTATASRTLTVNKATPTVTVTGGSFAYDGQPHPATGTARGVGGVTLSPVTFTYNGAPDPPVAAGSYEVIGTFAGNDNYNSATATATITITKAAPVLTWNAPAPIVYGTALSGDQLNASANVAGSFTYTPPAGTVLNAGSAVALSAQFTPTDETNYESRSISTTITVAKAAATVSVDGGTYTYDGQPHPATGTATGVGGADLGSLTFTYNGSANSPVNAGTYEVVGTFAGDANHNSASGTATITIAKASPVLTWNASAGIVYGTALSATQLNASANVPGSFAYTPAAGTVLNAGTARALSAEFTPTDAINYNGGTVSTTIDVAKAAATVSITGGTHTYDGQPHPATGTVTGAGGANLTPLTFTYNGQSAAPVNAGTYNVVGSFAGDANHDSASGTATIVIGKAAPALGWAAPGAIGYGTPLGATQLAATSNVAGTFIYAPAAGTVLPAGSHVLSATFSPADAANYTTGSIGSVVSVVPALLTVRANDASKRFGAPLPAFGVTFAGFVNGDTPLSLNGAVVLATPATPASAVGSYPIVPSGVSSPNYAVAFVNGTLSIVRGGVGVAVVSSPVPSGSGQPMTFTATVNAAAPAAGAPSGAVQFMDGATVLGTASVSSGVASLTTAGLSAGAHTIQALYLGDASFEAGSASTSHVVNTASSTPVLTLSSSRNPSSTGQSVTLTANVSMSSGSVNGSIEFWDGSTLLATRTISAGRATLTISSLANGSHAIIARYLGSPSAPPAISGVLVQAVGGSNWRNRTSSASVSSSANPAAVGSGITLTATIVGSWSAAPTGRVLFMLNGTVIGDPGGVPVTFVSGTTVRAQLPVAGLPYGAHKVTVTYLGDTNYKGSTAALTQTVN